MPIGPLVASVLLLLGSVGAEPPAAPAEAVTLRPVWTKGTHDDYRFKHRAIVTTREAGEERLVSTNLAGVLRLAVRETEDSGAALLVITILKIEATMTAMPTDYAAAIEGPLTFEWERPADGAPPAPDGGPAAGAVAAPLAALCAAELIVRVRPDGSIGSLRGTEEADAAAREHGEAGALALGPFGGASLPRFLERLWRVDDEEDDGFVQRAPGAKWQRTEERAMPHGAMARLVREHTLSGVDMPGLWPIEIVGGGTLAAPRGEPDPTRPTLKLEEWTERGLAVWDSAAGRIARRNDTLKARTAASIGGHAVQRDVQTLIEFEAVQR
ncbi:MAG: hypothetical protein KF699_05120 [Phycisphaeraceae bacterium]|nr:hypothetical protein [Phycisphaeraceae bacterium]